MKPAGRRGAVATIAVMPRHRLRPVVLLALVALAGCDADPNARPTVGEGLTIETLSGQDAAPEPRIAAAPDAPSLRRDSLSREHWARRPFDVPPDRPYHQPAYRFDRDDPGLLDTTSRQRFAYPTQSTALEAGDDQSDADQALEAVALPFVAGAELVAMPVRMVGQPPWTRERSPERSDRRLPPAMRMTDLLGPDADAFLNPPGSAGPVDVRGLPPEAYVFIDGRWVPVPEALRTLPPAPAAAPSPAPAPAPSLDRAPPRAAASPPDAGPAPASTRPATDASVASVPPVAPPPPAPRPTHYDGLPDNVFVYVNGKWITAKEAREGRAVSPGARP